MMPVISAGVAVALIPIAASGPALAAGHSVTAPRGATAV
jgi:hypothetical protein